MGQKDIAEKILEAYNDVFSDIVNVLLFNGDQILKENEHDAAISVTSSALRAHWNELCEEIEKLPEIEFLRNVYLKFGVKSRLSDIDLDDAVSKKLLDYSPLARNRLTLMRLRCCFNFLKRK